MNQNYCDRCLSPIGDHGPCPYIGDLDRLVWENTNFRTALWTGEHLQVTLMCIPVGGEIGLEMHKDVDQILRIESGCGLVMMGRCPSALCERQCVNSGFVVIVPAGTWHNLINTGNTPLKLYSVYGPPQHPFGTVHRTKQEAEMAE
ncbi:MAG: cupin domain-containing protein [Lachnospiraceae bacterium]|nr:cupin domain-containing protein [Lachnospiraceae bacterium]